MGKRFYAQMSNIFLVLFCIVNLTSCNNGSNSASPKPGLQTTTLIYYAFGADDLQPGMTAQLETLKEIGSNSNLNILIARGGGESWTTTEEYYITPEHTESLIFQGAQTAINQPATLTNFITTAMTNYPADRYMLVFSGHAGGINSTIGNMTVANMLSAIAAAKTNLGNAYANIDLIGFDNCLMSDSEIAAALAPYANYMVASQNFDYNWRTNVIFGLLANDPQVSTVDFGKFIINDYFQVESTAVSTLPVRTLAMTDLSQVSALVDSINNFAAQLATDYANGSYWVNYATALNKTISFYTDPFLSADNNSTDIMSNFNNAVLAFPEDLVLANLAKEVEFSVAKAVIYSKNGTSQLTQNLSGLNIYAPVITSAYKSDYGTNTQGFFASNYINLINSYVAYYMVESANLVANVGAVSYEAESFVYSANVGNPVALAQIVTLFGYESLPVLVYSSQSKQYESSVRSGYIAGTEALFESSSIVYAVNGSTKNNWIMMAGANNESYPVILLPDSNDYTINGNTYNIPAAWIKSGNIHQVGYLVASADADGNLTINTFVDINSDSTFSTGQSFDIESGDQYAPMVYVSYNGTYVYGVPEAAYEAPLTAPLSLAKSTIPLYSYQGSGSSLLTFFSTDITGSKTVSTPYYWQ